MPKPGATGSGDCVRGPGTCISDELPGASPGAPYSEERQPRSSLPGGEVGTPRPPVGHPQGSCWPAHRLWPFPGRTPREGTACIPTP